MSKLSIIVNPPKGQVELGFLSKVQKEVDEFFTLDNRSDVISSGRIQFSWFDDAPVSAGVAMTAEFFDLEAFDVLAELQIYLRKKGHIVSISLGY